MLKEFRRAPALGLVCVGAALGLALPADAGLLDKVIEGAPKRVELAAGSDMTAAYKEAFTPKGMFGSAPDPLAGANRKIAIAGFQVEFATEQKAIAHGNGVDAGLASTTDVIYTLKGVDPARLQAVTNRLQAGFVSILQARGYEVLPAGALAETAYKDALQKANQPPLVHERGTALDLVITPSEKVVDNASIIASAPDTAPDVFSHFLANLGPGPRAADALQANVVHVRLKLNFARFEETGWFLPDIDSKPQNTLGTSGTFIQVFEPGGALRTYPLSNMVILPHRVADEAVPVAADAGQTAQRAAGGVGRAALGLFKGIGGIGDVVAGTTASVHSVMGSGNYEVTAVDTYEEQLTEDGILALGLLAEAFAK